MLPLAGACSTDPTGPAAAPVVRGDGVAATLVRDCEVPAIADVSAVRLDTDVPYRAGATAEQHADYVVPARASAPVPVVVFIHGGGWVSGTTRQYGADMFRLATLGYASVSVGYRLAPVDRYPTQLADVRCAVRWVRAQGRRLGLDTTRIVVAGNSAGGHLAELVGLTTNDADLDGDCPNRGVGAGVSGVVAYSAPSDLRPGASISPVLGESVKELLGAAPAQAPTLAALASPVLHVRSGAPPFLLVHGADDQLVPLSHPRRMFDALRAAGVRATLVELPDVGHELPITDPGAASRAATCTTIGFLRNVFGR